MLLVTYLGLVKIACQAADMMHRKVLAEIIPSSDHPTTCSRSSFFCKETTQRTDAVAGSAALTQNVSAHKPGAVEPAALHFGAVRRGRSAL